MMDDLDQKMAEIGDVPVRGSSLQLSLLDFAFPTRVKSNHLSLK